MTPWTFLKSGNESGDQTALFMWANMAARYGYAAADDPQSYEVVGHAEGNYGFGRGGVYAPVPELLDMFAIPNGGLRDKITAGNLKREGVKKGVPDIMLPVARGGYHGLFIEMKRRKTARGRAGTTSDEQDDWIARLRARGYGAAHVVGFEATRTLIRNYLEQTA